MNSAGKTGFWNRRRVRNRLLKPLRDRSIGTIEPEHAWRQLRKHVMAERLRRNAPELNPEAAKVFQSWVKSGQPAVMLMEEIVFEQRLPKYLLTFAATLRSFHISMRRMHGKRYRRPLLRIELDKPRARAFLDVYRNLDFSTLACTLRDLGTIQARGVCCRSVSGGQSTIALTDYGIEDLVAVTTKIERYLTKSSASKRRHEAMTHPAMSSDTRSTVTLGIESSGRVRVSYKEPTWPNPRAMTLTNSEAKLLINLYWKHKRGDPWTSYDELAEALPLVSRKHRHAHNPNNRFSALRVALLTRLTTGLQLSARANWVKCKPGTGYGLDTDRLTWRETRNWTDQHAAAVHKHLRANAETSRIAGDATCGLSPE